MIISTNDVQKWLELYYGFKVSLHKMPGDEDCNYSFQADDHKYIIKISEGHKDESYFDFQTKILLHLLSNTDLELPEPVGNKNGDYYNRLELKGDFYWIRVITWVEGKLWSENKFFIKDHYTSLGQILATYGMGLKSFHHDFAFRKLEWDLNQADWVGNHLEIFDPEERPVISFFFKKYLSQKSKIDSLRKGIIHNDANDNNVLINKEGVVSIIDFGDAAHTQIINDLAIALTYALMYAPDLVEAGRLVVKGFHEHCPLLEEEIECLYTLVGVRLIISLTKSKQNYLIDPQNKYHQISSESGWDLIHKLQNLSEMFFTANLKSDCNYKPLESHKRVTHFLLENKIKPEKFLGFSDFRPSHISFDVGSNNLGLPETYLKPIKHQNLIDAFCEEKECSFVYGGYLECRPFYSTDAFKSVSVDGIKSRTIHLGEDYWVPAGTPVFAPLDGKVILVNNNAIEKDYGPTIVLEHKTNYGDVFYTLYGHLDAECLTRLTQGENIQKGNLLAYVGNYPENGNWAPHLHFQILMDLLGEKENFPGVCHADEIMVWSKICPDPKYLLDFPHYPQEYFLDSASLQDKRDKMISKALSLSYDTPLEIVRGDGAYLIDKQGQRYLDMVNNVAHVGHEHPEVVKVGQKQMAVLNTNSRYLHRAMPEYAENILKKFPEDYTNVFFVNSGSEANDLAIRMARTVSGSESFLALKNGYHGHSQATLDVSSYKFDGKGGRGRPSCTHLIDIESKDWREALQIIIEESNHTYGLAGSISESILSCAGQVVPDSKIMNEIFARVRENGGINIADEVQTGFGRVGSHFWAFQLHGLDPDIVTLGKPMGNGHPLGALVCKKHIVEKFENGMEFFSTYGGNPVSCAIGNKVLEVIENESLQAHALEIGEYLKTKLLELSNGHDCIYQIRGEGLFLGIEFRKSGQADPETCNWIVEALKSKKVLLSSDGPFHNVIKIKPPMVIGRKEVDYFLCHLTQLLDSWY